MPPFRKPAPRPDSSINSHRPAPPHPRLGGDPFPPCDPLVCLIDGHGDLCPGCRLRAQHREHAMDGLEAALALHGDVLRARLLKLLDPDIVRIVRALLRKETHRA